MVVKNAEAIPPDTSVWVMKGGGLHGGYRWKRLPSAPLSLLQSASRNSGHNPSLPVIEVALRLLQVRRGTRHVVIGSQVHRAHKRIPSRAITGRLRTRESIAERSAPSTLDCASERRCSGTG